MMRFQAGVLSRDWLDCHIRRNCVASADLIGTLRVQVTVNGGKLEFFLPRRLVCACITENRRAARQGQAEYQPPADAPAYAPVMSIQHTKPFLSAGCSDSHDFTVLQPSSLFAAAVPERENGKSAD